MPSRASKKKITNISEEKDEENNMEPSFDVSSPVEIGPAPVEKTGKKQNEVQV